MARYSIKHHPDAADELQGAAGWYEERDPRTAARFVEAVKLAEIARSSNRWPVEPDGTRHALVPPFKYKIVFRITGDIAQIIAYAHTSRRPGYWRKRIE